jgi:hypothetical protein
MAPPSPKTDPIGPASKVDRSMIPNGL